MCPELEHLKVSSKYVCVQYALIKRRRNNVERPLPSLVSKDFYKMLSVSFFLVHLPSQTPMEEELIPKFTQFRVEFRIVARGRP